MTQTKPLVCPQCGKSLPFGSPSNSCPQCLLGLAMNDAYQPTKGLNSGRLGDAHIPPVEKLVSEFPNLEIQHLIGHGGMGAVYQARQINLDRIIALKILSPKLGSDPAFAERFLREARTLAKLSHPHIVTVFDFGQAGEFYFLTMEFIDGVNLRDTISAELLTPAEALAIIPQVCDALQYAHDNGVIHRDIKPENILIAKDGRIKIADFGLAKLLQPHPDQFTLTGTRQVLGTMNYMAPEQIEKPEVVDHRADLYSLGVVFYELLTGELPLGRFSLPSEKSEGVSNRLDDVVMRTLEKDPDRRYQQASQIKTACEEIEKPNSYDSPNVGQARADFRQADPPADSNPVPLGRSFPITIEEIYHGLAHGYGLMRGFETHLELEFEIRDFTDALKSDAKTVQVPLERIASIKITKGFIYIYIDVQCDQIDVVSKIPNSKQGGFRVYLKKENLGEGEHLVQRVNEILGYTPVHHPVVPMPPLKSPFPQRHGSSGGVLGTVLMVLFFGFCAVIGLSVLLAVTYFSFGSKDDVPRGQIEMRDSGDFADEEDSGVIAESGAGMSLDQGTTKVGEDDEDLPSGSFSATSISYQSGGVLGTVLMVLFFGFCAVIGLSVLLAVTYFSFGSKDDVPRGQIEMRDSGDFADEEDSGVIAESGAGMSLDQGTTKVGEDDEDLPSGSFSATSDSSSSERD